MKILLFDDSPRGIDDRTCMGFFLQLSGLKGVSLYVASPTKIASKEQFNLIVKDFGINILLFHMHSPALIKSWPDYLFRGNKIPTVLIEEDHFEMKFNNLVYDVAKMFNWYKEKGINLLIRRHSYEEEAPIVSVFLPFSANEGEFFPGEHTHQNIGFAGSHKSTQAYYDIRKKAIKVLSKSGQLDTYYGKIYDGYAEYLRSHIGSLACSDGMAHTCVAKIFEVPLSGSALLTNVMTCKEELWGKEQCYFEYKDDCSDIVSVADTIINEHDLRNQVIKNAYNRVVEYHTDEKRVKELYSILTALLSNKTIPRIWGQ